MFAETLPLKKGLGSKMRWVWVVGAGLEVPRLGTDLSPLGSFPHLEF